MKKYVKNLLPGKAFEGVALNQILSKISLRSPKWFQWLIMITFIFINLSGYYPNFGIPPIKKFLIQASASEQKGEIIASSFSEPLSFPHPGYLSTKFSSWHPGVDIATSLGMPIRPIIKGEVLEIGRDFFGLGNFVEVLHQDGFKSKYAHMGKIYVKVGQKVNPDSALGEVGLTGATSGPHTHLEITHNGKYIDPQTILPEIPTQ